MIKIVFGTLVMMSLWVAAVVFLESNQTMSLVLLSILGIGGFTWWGRVELELPPIPSFIFGGLGMTLFIFILSFAMGGR